MTRRPVSLALPLGLALGITAEWAALRRAPLELPASAADIRLAAVDFATGAAVLVAGSLLVGRTPGDRVGRLLLTAGLAWFLGSFAASGMATYADLGAAFVTLHRGPLVHALLSAPDGRLRGRIDRGVVAAVYVLSAVPPLARTGEALLLTALIIVFGAIRRLNQASGAARAATVVPVAGAGALAAVLTASAIVVFGGYGTFADRTVLWGYDIVIAAAVVSVTVDVRLGRWARSTVTQLVVDLGGGAALRERLARALGDPSIRVGYRVPGRDEYVDETGAAVPLGSEPPSRTITPLTQGESDIGVLVHAAPVHDSELLAGVAAAARIAVANVRLQAEVRRQIGELLASRRRLVEAGDAQRRRIEDAIRHGPERALARGAEILETLPATSSLADVRRELERAREELAAFAHGVHPHELSEGGLPAALRDLTRYSPVLVELDVSPFRLPAPVEDSAYFVCAEALANAGKHAHATRVTVRAHVTDDRLSLSVEDDGVGGADPAGAGLRGLADRVETLGGRIEVSSSPGGGTRILAQLPCTTGPQP